MTASGNWMSWKRQILGVLLDLGLDIHCKGVANEGQPTAEEIEAQWKWREGDVPEMPTAKACTVNRVRLVMCHGGDDPAPTTSRDKLNCLNIA